MKSLFDLCVPREDVLKGTARDSDFAADLAQVLNNKAPKEYLDPKIFFANTYPTIGLQSLLKNVSLRLTGRGGEAASIFRLDTQYGGGKTHSLIALNHLAKGMQGVENVEEFIDPQLIPGGNARVAAFDGENADPLNGRPLEQGLRAYTPWGELAYHLAGVEGYEQVRRSDIERVAPGAETVRDLFGGKPTLILLDELGVYLRKVRHLPEADQLTPFLTSLFKAVESSPGAALVFTLAIGKEGKAVDAYSAENEFLARYLEEAESVAGRKATALDPTMENETAQVLRRRLFSRIDDAGAAEVISAYRDLWTHNSDKLPPQRIDEDRVSEFSNGFPLHPELMSALTDKLSTLGNFQRVRGMLRLLTQTVAKLWEDHPANTYAIHLCHMDPGYEPIHNEVVTRLGLGSFDPAIRNDVSSSLGGASLAQEIDASNYAGMPPYCSMVARSILWHTFAFNEHLKGVNEPELRYTLLGPGLDVDFIDDARKRFMATSAYLDDRPNVALRFSAEVNLTQLIRRQESQVDAGEARAQLRDRIRTIFSGTTLQLVPFAGGPYEVPDDVGDGRPCLVLVNHDAEAARNDALQVPELVEKIFRFKGAQNDFRQLQNNLVFLMADEVLKEDMRGKMVRRLALEAMRQPQRLSDLVEHQQQKVQELYQRSEQELALAIQHCYRHLFFPSRNNRVEAAGIDLGHTAFEIQSASERPGEGERQILRALNENQKLLRGEDPPLAPNYVRDQTPLKQGQMTTADLRNEFRKDTRLPIMLGDDNFVTMVRHGIEANAYVYRSGDLLLGPGDPWAEVKVDQQSVVFTMAYATEQGIWPRQIEKEPEAGSTGEGEGTTGGVQGDGSGIETGHDGETVTQTGGDGSQPTFQAEAPLREALIVLWEKARGAKVVSLSWLSLRVFDPTDAFRLLIAVNGVTGAQKRVELTAEYETAEGSALRLTFNGQPDDAQPLKDFLEPQFRASSEKALDTVYTLTFREGLPMAGDAPEKLAERLARFATGAALVEASAEARS